MKDHTHKISFCPDCFGIYASRDVMRERFGGDLSESHAQRLLAGRDEGDGAVCPFDGRRMTQCDSLGVIVDVCAQCEGIWFDETEYGRILAKKDREDITYKSDPLFYELVSGILNGVVRGVIVK